MPNPVDDPTVRGFLARHPGRSAAVTLTAPQALREILIGTLLLGLCLYDWKLFLAAALFGLTTFYVAISAYKLFIVLVSCLFRPEIRLGPGDLARIPDSDLPGYTVLIPMYKETAVADKIVRAMNALDYPRDRLDIKLLLEEDDVATVEQCRALELPSCVQVVVVPHAYPKTKPKACNHGLLDALGEFLVIYDAEDRPEPDQLRKAVTAFRRLPEKVACLQAKLNYYNPYQNWLTGFFTLEYTAWFDLFLPGLVACRAPIPLGGTSNHFRVNVLKDIGGWDPFNLTEDCDLGVRLHAAGFRTRILDSTTWEEANSRPGNWIRQRSRWVKGYLQSHFVHTRSFYQALRELGPFGLASFLLTVGGQSLAQLLNPLFWVAGLVYIALAMGSLVEVGPGPWQLVYGDTVGDLPGAPLTAWSQWSIVFFYAAVGLLAANGLFILVNLLAVVRRRVWRLTWAALLSPFYWALGSVAAWKGFLQLFSRPFYWEKTQHGLDAHPDTHNKTVPVEDADGDTA